MADTLIQQVKLATTVGSNQVRLRLPPKAARTVGPPNGADAPMNQSREALLAAWPLHSPEGGMTSGDPAFGGRRGTHPERVGNDVGIDGGNDVGVNRLGHGGTGPGPAGLRSLPAKQHAPKARPHPWVVQPGRHPPRPGTRPPWRTVGTHQGRDGHRPHGPTMPGGSGIQLDSGGHRGHPPCSFSAERKGRCLAGGRLSGFRSWLVLTPTPSRWLVCCGDRGSEPQRCPGGLHGLVGHGQQLAGQGIQVDFLP
jgi:hypothetical protein